MAAAACGRRRRHAGQRVPGAGHDDGVHELVDAALERVRAIALALPGVTERVSHGAPTWFAGKKVMTQFLDDHHGDGRLALWCPAPPGVQAQSVQEEPARFFVPPYVGGRGWLGVRLDVDVDWVEVAAIMTDSFRLVAPKSLVRKLPDG